MLVGPGREKPPLVTLWLLDCQEEHEEIQSAAWPGLGRAFILKHLSEGGVDGLPTLPQGQQAYLHKLHAQT